MTRLPGILAGIMLASAVVLAAAAQSNSQSAATVSQVIPVVASVPVTLDDGTVQTITVPLTVTLNVNIDVEGATTVGADVEQAVAPVPFADEVTLENAGDFLPALADMPEGFKLLGEGEGSTNEELAESWPDPAAALEQLDSLGRQGSYYRTFQAPGFPLIGNARIDFSVILFDDAKGAAESLALYRERSQGRVDNGEYTALSPISMPNLGDSSDAYVFSKPASAEGANDAYDEYTISVAKGNVVVSLAARSFPGVGDAKQLIDFAKWIEQRLP